MTESTFKCREFFLTVKGVGGSAGKEVRETHFFVRFRPMFLLNRADVQNARGALEAHRFWKNEVLQVGSSEPAAADRAPSRAQNVIIYLASF